MHLAKVERYDTNVIISKSMYNYNAYNAGFQKLYVSVYLMISRTASYC